MAIKQKTNFYIYIFFLALFSTNFYLGYILDGNNFFLIFPGYTFFHLMQLILLLIPILINWNRLIKYYKQFKLNLYYRFFLFYLFVSFLSIFRSVNPTQSFYKYLILVMALFNIVLIVSSIFSVTNKQDFDKVIYNIWFSVAKISTLFFLILLMGYIFNPYSYSYPVFKGTIDRLYGSSFFLVAPNITSQIAAVNLLFYINFRSKCENKLIMDFIFIVSFFALILSQSRITLFALIILLLIRGFYLFFGKTKIFLKIVILFFSILIISFGLLYKSDFISYSLRGQDQNAIITGTGRTTYWFLAYNYLSNHNKTFYFGDGYYTGARFFNDKLRGKDFIRHENRSNLDSSILEVWLNSGIISLIPLLIFISAFFYIFYIHRNKGDIFFHFATFLIFFSKFLTGPSIDRLDINLLYVFIILSYLSKLSTLKELGEN